MINGIDGSRTLEKKKSGENVEQFILVLFKMTYLSVTAMKHPESVLSEDKELNTIIHAVDFDEATMVTYNSTEEMKSCGPDIPFHHKFSDSSVVNPYEGFIVGNSDENRTSPDNSYERNDEMRDDLERDPVEHDRARKSSMRMRIAPAALRIEGTILNPAPTLLHPRSEIPDDGRIKGGSPSQRTVFAPTQRSDVAAAVDRENKIDIATVESSDRERKEAVEEGVSLRIVRHGKRFLHRSISGIAALERKGTPSSLPSEHEQQLSALNSQRRRSPPLARPGPPVDRSMDLHLPPPLPPPALPFSSGKAAADASTVHENRVYPLLDENARQLDKVRGQGRSLMAALLASSE